jgi:hypothetical protein
VQISDERKKLVVDLYFNQHKTYAEIAQIERISPRDIHAIIKEEEARRQKYKDQQQQEEISSKAYGLFSKGKHPVEVAIALNLRQPEATKLYREYWILKRLHKLYYVYTELGDEGIGGFLKLYRLMKEKGMSMDQVVNAVGIAIHKLPYMESLYRQAKDQAEKMQRTRQGLLNDIEESENKISLLDKIAFASEQDGRRIQQQVQEVTAKKDRLEKLIANILNGEGYSKLKQIVKENIKDIVAENRKLISVSFVALIQTLKADPQMVKLIQNMPSANDCEQYKDNNNIVKYLESNKDSILGLAEKNYENLLEALTNNVIATASSSFNSTLPSSSTIPNLSNQSDIYRTKEPEIYDDEQKYFYE